MGSTHPMGWIDNIGGCHGDVPHVHPSELPHTTTVEDGECPSEGVTSLVVVRATVAWEDVCLGLIDRNSETASPDRDHIRPVPN